MSIGKGLTNASGELSDEYSYHSAKIKNSSLVNGIKFYETGISKFLGNSVIKRLEGIRFKSDEEIRARLKPDTTIGKGEWVDISGLIAPKSEVDQLLDNIERGNKENEGEKEIGNEFLHLHDAERVFLLLIAILHREAVAKTRTDVSLCTA